MSEARAPEDVPVAPRELDRGTAGASARRRYERLHEQREQAARDRLGKRLGGLYLALSTEPQEKEHLVFTPTPAQLDEWDAARDRGRDVRAALIERHRDALPKFTGDSVAAWEAYYGERKLREDEIAKEFDTQRGAAKDQFYRGDHGWLSTLEGAIRELEIPDQEVEELRARSEARLADAEAALRAT